LSGKKKNISASDESKTNLDLILAGPEGWRDGTVARLKPDKRFAVTEKIEADFNGVDLARISSADVLVSTADPKFVAPAIKLAVALQKKIHALAVVFVLPTMFSDELGGFDDYRQAWTLLSAKTGDESATQRRTRRESTSVDCCPGFRRLAEFWSTGLNPRPEFPQSQEHPVTGPSPCKRPPGWSYR
jgi:hypothetical protein